LNLPAGRATVPNRREDGAMGCEHDRLIERNALRAIFDAGEGMLLPPLDGFVAGLIVWPEPVTPAEWLPVVFGAAGSPATGRGRTQTTIAATPTKQAAASASSVSGLSSALALLAESAESADAASGDGPGEVPDKEVQRSCGEATELFPHDVATLLGRDGPAATATPTVGRNDPCPCGPDRKFKKFCGA
jgi:uncharacterized protein YecA (UPF0149 family)